MSKKLLIIGGVTAVVVLIGAGSYFLVGNRGKNQYIDVKGTQTTLTTSNDTKTGLQLSYNSILKPQQLSQQDIEDKFIFRLASTNPAILVSVRYEEGLSAVSALARQELYDLLATNTLKALPQRFPGFELQSQQKQQIASREALDLVFTYTGPNGAQATQRFIVIVKDPNTAIYISAQTSSTDYNSLNTEYIETLIKSLNFNS